jgi:hypothetical protein
MVTTPVPGGCGSRSVVHRGVPGKPTWLVLVRGAARAVLSYESYTGEETDLEEP